MDYLTAKINNGKRAHHNALERKRRDHIKDSFHSLRDVVPIIHKSKISRAQILKKATEYLQALISQTKNDQMDIEEIQKQNRLLEQKIMYLQKIKFEVKKDTDDSRKIDQHNSNHTNSQITIESSQNISTEHSYSV